MQSQFNAHALLVHSSPDQFVPEPLVPAKKAFEQSLNALFDEGACDVYQVVDAIAQTDDALLVALDPMLKSRMMGVLSEEFSAFSRNAMRQTNAGEREFARTIRKTGQRIAIHTPVPMSVVKRFYALENQFAERVRDELATAKQNGYVLDLEMPVNDQSLKEAALYFNGLLSEIYQHAFETQTVVVNDPKSKTMGSAGFDAAMNKLVIESNIAGTKTMGDLPALIGTLGHENIHSVVASFWNQPKFDPEYYRHTNPDFYMMMRICDRNFYSLEKDVYRRHPEEIFAERLGMRLGVVMSRLMGKPRLKDEFKLSALSYDSPIIAAELDFIYRTKNDNAANDGKTLPTPKSSL